MPKNQINAYPDDELAWRFEAERKADDRTASKMATILIKEALDARDARRNSKAA